jgi:hypothetical protein
MHKVIREYRQLCRSEGVPLIGIESRGRHYALHFEGRFLIAASTPSDHRAYQNLRASIRRMRAGSTKK